jgi:hypothetical protein
MLSVQPPLFLAQAPDLEHALRVGHSRPVLAIRLVGLVQRIEPPHVHRAAMSSV